MLMADRREPGMGGGRAQVRFRRRKEVRQIRLKEQLWRTTSTTVVSQRCGTAPYTQIRRQVEGPPMGGGEWHYF